MKRSLIIATLTLIALGLGYFIWTIKSAVDEKFAFIDHQVSAPDTIRATEDNTRKIRSNTRQTPAKIEALKGNPTSSFKTLVQALDSLGYSSDTLRVKQLKNYKELLPSKITLFNTLPFYKINKAHTKILRNTYDKTDSIDVEVFYQAQTVWGYFYRKKEHTDLTVDGVIEQWTFSNNDTAQIALNKLKAIYPLPYFNTEPYYFIEDRHLFIFHTRASAFSYKQKEFFTLFKTISSAPK